MKKVLLWLWQLPQNLAGLCISKFSKNILICEVNHEPITIYFLKKFFGSAVSLGNYIIMQSTIRNSNFWVAAKHEHGHQKQSLYLGPLYLLIIGLPSFIGNIYSRIIHKSNEWYYSQPWEAWADKLGKVER